MNNLKTRNLKQICREISEISAEISEKNEENFRKLKKIQQINTELGDFNMLPFLTMLAEIFKEVKEKELERFIFENKANIKNFDVFQKNILERIEILDEANENGIEIANEDFQKNMYSFLSKFEEIDFVEDGSVEKFKAEIAKKYNKLLDDNKNDEEEEEHAEA